MKKLILLIMAFFMCNTLNASVEFLKKHEFSSDYANVISSIEMGSSSGDIFIENKKSSTGFDFRVGFVESLLEIKSKEQNNGTLLDTVAVWISYRF